jgi:hypothetical protein
MSKIDEYKRAKKKAESLREFALADKFGMRIKIEETWLGYYGSSSAYSWTDDQIEEVKHQIDLELRNIVQHAAERVGFTAEQAREAAADEAREVLAVIGEA